MTATVVEKNSFKGIGLKWVGTFEQAAKGDIQNLFTEFKSKIDSIPNKVNPNTMVGLSYHNIENGFTLYLVSEVSDTSVVPEGMEVISVPAYTFVATAYNGNEVQEEYMKLYKWIEDNNYALNQEELEHLEEYPVHYNVVSDQPNLKIHIPIKSA